LTSWFSAVSSTLRFRLMGSGSINFNLLLVQARPMLSRRPQGAVPELSITATMDHSRTI
jgi:hypothetical protein